MCVCPNVNLGGRSRAMRYVFDGRAYYGHGGDINGFAQPTMHNKADSVTLSMAINRNDAPRGPIAATVFQVVFDQPAVGVEVAVDERSVHLYPNPEEDFCTRTPSCTLGLTTSWSWTPRGVCACRSALIRAVPCGSLLATSRPTVKWSSSSERTAHSPSN
jgi:hypothetical protein